MNLCDFSAVVALIKKYITEDLLPNQVDLMYELFGNFMSDEENTDFDFDNGLVCRWIKGQARISPRICSYYRNNNAKNNLKTDIAERILPISYDSSMLTQELQNLVIQDSGISEKQKKNLLNSYPCKTAKQEAECIADVLCFTFDRPFIKRDNQTKNLLFSANLSPMLSNFIMDDDFPKPCKWFCGREKEIADIHALLTENNKLFLTGIAGIGKSEVAKAYAKTHKNDYTNILYINYSGNLVADISNLDFIDDLDVDNNEEKFKKHNRFLRSLKEDSLIIIDNFNSTKDDFLSIILKYRCKIIFTTRNKFTNYKSMILNEIEDKNTLFQLVSAFYSQANENQNTIFEIINSVHSHTFAVELIARLLENGILEPDELFEKLLSEKVNISSSDKIGANKDGFSSNETYYNHIRMLFSLYELSSEQQKIMCNMTVMPKDGISARRFAIWLKLSNLNTINELIEMGFITDKPARVISLHPMVLEIALADIKPTVTKCFNLCDSIQNECLMHGIDLPYHSEMFETVQNIINFTQKDEQDFYLRFLEDVFPYMEKYQHEYGKKLIILELSNLLKNQSFATNNSRALLLDFKASMEKKPEKAIKFEKDALSVLGELNENNAHLKSNLHANLGALYRATNKDVLAKENMEIGIAILEQFNICETHDTVPQITNYSILLAETGEAERGILALKKLLRTVKNHNSDVCEDYANVHLSISSIYIAIGDTAQATKHYQQAIEIFQTLYPNNPELLESKFH
ncbi:MAG: Archaeal ATPase [Clostridia bacterium]